MRKYSYHGFMLVKLIWEQIGGWFVILFFGTLALFLIIAPFFVISGTSSVNFLDDPRLPPILFGLLFLIGALNGGSLFANSLPIIWTDDTKITISYFSFFHKSIPWSEITEVVNEMPSRGFSIIKARKITPFHYVIGWIYSRSFVPVFLINENIDDYELLISGIKAKILNSKRFRENR